jgi:uncharacterized protein YbjT (DUF2867 family)
MILVTGSTGKVGQEVVKELARAGAAFRVGTRAPKKVDASDAVLFDLDRPETFGRALSGIEKLFLLSSGGTEREGPVVDAAKKAGVRHVVKLSVWGAEGEKVQFGREHRPIEKRIEASGLAWTFLRPNSFMQNYVVYQAGTIKSQGAFYLPDRDARISVIDTRDIGAVAAKALTESGHEGKAYSLSGPEALNNAEIAEKISRAIGKTVRYVDIPEEDYRKGAIAAGVPPVYVEALVDLQRFYIAGHGAAVTPDVERVLGRKPISFDQFAQDYAKAWQ